MPSTKDSKPTREWELEDMNHHDAGIREVLIIALEKHESGEDPVILTTDEINAEVIGRGLRDRSILAGKKKGALIGSYTKRETGRNLAPPLLVQIGRGRYRFNPYYLEKLKQFGERWRLGETTAVSPQDSRMLRVQRCLESLHKEVARLSAKADTVAGQVRSLIAEEIRELSFVHTSPDFAGTAYAAKVTSIKDTIGSMLQRAKQSIRISTRQIDMFEDQLIRLKEDNPDLSVVVISRGPEGTTGARKGLAGVAFEKMKEAGIKMYIERHALHSRMVVVDEREALVSSADLDYTQMEKEFNAGIWTNDQAAVAEAIRYFDNLLRSPTVTVPK